MTGGLTTTDGEIMELLHSQEKEKPCNFKELFCFRYRGWILSIEFKWHAYQKVGKSNDATIIHYIGDETVAAAFPHHNRTKCMVSHIHACLSYLSKCAKQCKTMKPGLLYAKKKFPNQVLRV